MELSKRKWNNEFTVINVLTTPYDYCSLTITFPSQVDLVSFSVPVYYAQIPSGICLRHIVEQ